MAVNAEVGAPAAPTTRPAAVATDYPPARYAWYCVFALALATMINFLDRGVRVMDAWMKTTQNPHYEGFFMYGDNKPHCWSGPGTQLDRILDMANDALRKKPEGTTTPWWTY